MRRLLSLYLLVLIGTLSSSVAMGAERTPWYKVELIVFTRPTARASGEAWPRESPTLAPGRELVPWQGYAGQATVPFQRLPADSLRLGWEYTRLKGDLNPLLHIGWLQPGLARNEAVPVHIRSEDGAGGSLDGTVRVILSRYLHLEANLAYRRAKDANLPDGARPIFVMNESRRMRSREVHYLDNPMFGVIALITPYELPAGNGAN